MQTLFKKTMIILVVVAMISTPFGTVAIAEDQTVKKDSSPEEMIVDGLLLRPLGIAATGLGIACFIVTLPFSLITGQSNEAAKKMVGKPAKFTFQRQLGDF